MPAIRQASLVGGNAKELVVALKVGREPRARHLLRLRRGAARRGLAAHRHGERGLQRGVVLALLVHGIHLHVRRVGRRRTLRRAAAGRALHIHRLARAEPVARRGRGGDLEVTKDLITVTITVSLEHLLDTPTAEIVHIEHLREGDRPHDLTLDVLDNLAALLDHVVALHVKPHELHAHVAGQPLDLGGARPDRLTPEHARHLLDVLSQA
mmetsp:Transcript_2178/g.4838  ORF Transcript_2178/g.4838 Transcript_2178/m.4838 type:complete len:210 (+) Transcript_2178:666-1295(+)